MVLVLNVESGRIEITHVGSHRLFRKEFLSNERRILFTKYKHGMENIHVTDVLLKMDSGPPYYIPSSIYFSWHPSQSSTQT